MTMRYRIAAALLAGSVLAPSSGFANDQTLLEGSRIRDRHETRMGAAEAWAALPHVVVEWAAPLFGLKPELDRWMVAQGPRLQQLLKDTGMPGILVSARRETVEFDGRTVTRLVGGEPVLMGPGLSLKSTAIAYERGPSITRGSVGGARYDEQASEYLWVEEKNGELRWSSYPAIGLNNEVRLAEADALLAKTRDRSYDAEAAARVIDHLAVNDVDEALRRQAKMLSEARTKALADAKRINDELYRALERDRRANAAAQVFQAIATAGNLAGAITNYLKEVPEAKAKIDGAAASGSVQDTKKAVGEFASESAAAAGRARQKMTENSTLQMNIRRSQQDILNQRQIPNKVRGIDWILPQTEDRESSIPIQRMP
ncbi:hypothetical protein [Methylobacterium radiotolerans]